MAADLRREFAVDVQMAEGHYGEFSVQVDGRTVLDAGALAFLGVLPSKRQVRDAVADALDGKERGSSGSAKGDG